MQRNEENKPNSTPIDPCGSDPPVDFSALLNRTLSQLNGSRLWPIITEGKLADAIGEQVENIPVRVHARRETQAGSSRVELPATLRMTHHSDGSIDVQVMWDVTGDDQKTALKAWEPFGMLVVPLSIWQFEEVVWHEENEENTDGSVSPAASAQADTVHADAASHSLSAKSVSTENIKAANDRLELATVESEPQEDEPQEKDRLLRLTLDQPPLRRGQPVVVEARYQENDDQPQTHTAQALTLNTTVNSGEHHMSLREDFENPIPEDCPNFEIKVRPLRAEDLDLLSPSQVQEILARHAVTALTPRGSGRSFSAAVTCADQRSAVIDPTASWHLLVTKREVK